MSHFANKEDLLQTIQTYFEKIDAGKLNSEELEDLVQTTRELHERTLILRYKAYEEKVLGVKEIPQQIDSNTTDPWASAVPFEQVEEEILMEESKNEEEDSRVQAEETLITPEVPVFDFHVDDQAEAGFAFDLFDSKPTEIQSTQETEMHTESQSFPETASEAIGEEEISIINPAPEAVSHEMKEEAIVSIPTPASDPFKGMYLSDQHDLPTFMKVKIYTLNGSFGLNEKMQFISELFNQSSEEFNHVVHQLDALNTFSEARSILVENSIKYTWDLESKAVAEFIQKVERRFL